MERIGLEAGPLSQWLHAGLAKAGLFVELIETRHVRAAFKTMSVKTDKKDARGIAQLMRLGWFRPVHCKSLPAQEVRALLTARRLIQGKLQDIETSIRGILRGFGLKVGPTTRRTYAARIRELIESHPTLEAIAASLLKMRGALIDEFAGVDRELRAMARQDDKARRLMTIPGVGVLVELTFVAAVDAPERFRSSRAVGLHFELTAKKYQSGETDYSGRISKIGDAGVRTALYEAANVILTRPVRGSDMKSWALAVARRAGPKKARLRWPVNWQWCCTTCSGMEPTSFPIRRQQRPPKPGGDNKTTFGRALPSTHRSKVPSPGRWSG
jgi:transposase